MRKSIYVFLTLGIVACQHHIKNDLALLDNQENVGVEDLAYHIPKPNKNLAVNKKEDLIGYWVGDLDIELNDSARGSNDNTYEKGEVTFVIDEINNLNIKGHSLFNSRVYPIEGEIKETNTGFKIIAEEKVGQYIFGLFELNIDLNKNDLICKWSAKSYSNEKSKNGILQKKNFIYDPNAKLERRYLDYEKKKNDQKSKKKYIRRTAFATSNKILEINSSTQKITDEIAQELNKADILILKNLIYAHHGFIFKDKLLRAYFDQNSWYMAINNDVSKDLTDLEKQNIKKLDLFEKNAKEYYAVFGR